MDKEKKISKSGSSSSVLKPNTCYSYEIQRQIMCQDEMLSLSGYKRDKGFSLITTMKKYLANFSIVTMICNYVPIVEWLPKYKIKDYLPGDITAGFTVGIMQIPVGMAYALLAGVPPIVGLYMAFFPVLVYAIFGTSRHLSMGTLAVISLLVDKSVQSYSILPGIDLENKTTNGMIKNASEFSEQFSPIQVAIAVTFVAGCYHIVMSFLRLGALSNLMSEPLVSGFTTATAIHIVVSQFKDLFGVTIPRHKGAFNILLTVKDIFLRIGETNYIAFSMSLICVLFLLFMNDFLRPWTMKYCKLPIPSELMAVVGCTLCSYALDLSGNYQVSLVGSIPTGLPMPEVPSLHLMRLVAIETIGVTIVSYTINMSLAIIFAEKDGYEVDANQELFALGMSNVVGSFFSCIPNVCALSRTSVQYQTGGRTQLASVFAALLMLVVLLWIGPCFELLPRCVLAAVIFVALKPMLLKIGDFEKFLSEGKLEAIVWMISFLSVIVIDLDMGLLIGVVISLVVLYIKGWKTYYQMLGTIPGSGIYLDVKSHTTVIEIPQTKIFKFIGPVNFANKSDFRTILFREIKIDGKIIRRASLNLNVKPSEHIALRALQKVILELSAIPHVDTSTCKMFNQIQKDLNLLGISTFFTGPNDCVYDALIKASSLECNSFKIFPTIHDAVLYRVS